jgi:hypothetical protein
VASSDFCVLCADVTSIFDSAPWFAIEEVR